MTTQPGANQNQDPNANQNPNPQAGEGNQGLNAGGNQDADGNTDGNQDDKMGWTPDQLDYIQKLRKENASYRTRAKNNGSQVEELSERLSMLEGGLKQALGFDDGTELTPEQQVQALNQNLEGAITQNQFLEMAIDNGIGKESKKYFEFLLTDRVNNLEEGEELTDEDIAELALEAKSKTGVNVSTSVPSNGAGDSNTQPNPNPNNEITVEQFSKMTFSEKTDLSLKNRSLYEKLMVQAKEKRMFI